MIFFKVIFFLNKTIVNGLYIFNVVIENDNNLYYIYHIFVLKDKHNLLQFHSHKHQYP